jgi:hypothetical protein
MCFKSSGPSAAETEEQNKTAAEARVAAEEAKRSEIENLAKAKREDITEALDSRQEREGTSGGKGRRSLFSSSTGGAGFLNRFT